MVEALRADLSTQQRAAHAAELARLAAEAQTARLAEEVAALQAEVEEQVARGVSDGHRRPGCMFV